MLKELDLTNVSDLNGESLEPLVALENLEVLDLDENFMIDGSAVDFLIELKKLKKLKIGTTLLSSDDNALDELREALPDLEIQESF
jgi:hypothetical protein